MKEKKLNIAFVASQGGHSGQIKILFTKEVIGKHNAIFITETPNKDLSMKKNYFLGKFKVYFFKKDVLLFPEPIRYITTMLDLMKIFRKEKIDLIVTNGAQLSIPAIIATKFLGIKSIFIDTVIRVVISIH